MGSGFEVLLGYNFLKRRLGGGACEVSRIGDVLGVCFWCGGDLDCEMNDTHLYFNHHIT